MVPSPLKDCMTLTPSSPGAGHFHQSAPFPKQLQKANTCRGAQGAHSIAPRCPTTRSCCACGCVPSALPRLPVLTAPAPSPDRPSRPRTADEQAACETGCRCTSPCRRKTLPQAPRGAARGRALCLAPHMPCWKDAAYGPISRIPDTEKECFRATKASG